MKVQVKGQPHSDIQHIPGMRGCRLSTMGPDPLANVVGQLHISRTQYFMRCHKSIVYSEPDVRSILALSLTCVDVNAHVDMRRVMQGLAAHHAALLTPIQFTVDVSDDPVRVRTCIALMTLGELGEFGGSYTPAIAEMIHNLDNDLSEDLMAVGRSAVRAPFGRTWGACGTVPSDGSGPAASPVRACRL